MRELQGAIIVGSAFQAVLGYSGLMSLILRYKSPLPFSQADTFDINIKSSISDCFRVWCFVYTWFLGLIVMLCFLVAHYLLTLLLYMLINPVVVAPTIAAVGLSFYSYGFPLVGKCIEIGVVQILLVVIFALVSLFKLLLTAFEK